MARLRGNFQLRMTAETVVTLLGVLALVIGCCALVGAKALRHGYQGYLARIGAKGKHQALPQDEIDASLEDAFANGSDED